MAKADIATAKENAVSSKKTISKKFFFSSRFDNQKKYGPNPGYDVLSPR